METQKKTRGTFQSKPQQTASKTREQFYVWAANAEFKNYFSCVKYLAKSEEN